MFCKQEAAVHMASVGSQCLCSELDTNLSLGSQLQIQRQWLMQTHLEGNNRISLPREMSSFCPTTIYFWGLTEASGSFAMQQSGLRPERMKGSIKMQSMTKKYLHGYFFTQYINIFHIIGVHFKQLSGTYHNKILGLFKILGLHAD